MAYRPDAAEYLVVWRGDDDAPLADNEMEAFGQILDASGSRIYPGIIAPQSTLGLIEVGAVRATNDRETLCIDTKRLNRVVPERS